MTVHARAKDGEKLVQLRERLDHRIRRPSAGSPQQSSANSGCRIPVVKSIIWQYLVVGETHQKIVSGSRPHLAVLYTRRLASAGRSVQWPNGIERGSSRHF